MAESYMALVEHWAKRFEEVSAGSELRSEDFYDEDYFEAVALQRHATSPLAAFSMLVRDSQLNVEAVYCDGITRVAMFVITNNPSQEERKDIYRAEMGIMEMFEGLKFDFHVIDRRDRRLEDIATLDGYQFIRFLEESDG
jgi:hypothetical protein